MSGPEESAEVATEPTGRATGPAADPSGRGSEAPGDSGAIGSAPVTSADAPDEAVPDDEPWQVPGSPPARGQADITALERSRGDDRSSDEGAEPAAVEPASEARSVPALRTILESVLLVVDQPVDEVSLAQVVERPRHEVVEALRALAAEYDADGRGFDLRCVAGGWRLYTREECAPFVERFVLEGQQARLTQAALETLAVVAYRQPVTRGRVAAVRGVNVDGVMRTLVARGLVEEAGHEPDSGAVLYRTTGYFLERLGLNALSDLPPLAPFLPEIESIDAESDQDSTPA